MGRFLIDTNVISHYFSVLFTDEGMDFVSKIIDDEPIISVITEIEALSWVNNDQRKELVVRDFILDSKILPLTSQIVDQCIRLRRSRKIKIPDSIIAATAIIYDLTLVSSDGIFEQMDGLKLIQPSKL